MGYVAPALVPAVSRLIGTLAGRAAKPRSEESGRGRLGVWATSAGGMAASLRASPPRTECKIRRNDPLDVFCDFARAGAEGGKPGGTYGVLTSRPGFFAARSGSGEGRRAIAASGDAGVEGVSRRADCLRGRCEEKGSQVLLRQDPRRVQSGDARDRVGRRHRDARSAQA